MQKNLKLFFVHNLQKQLYPLNPCPLGKLQQYPPGTPSPKDAAQVFIYPPLYFQCVRLTTFTWIWMIPNCCKCRTPFFAQRFART